MARKTKNELPESPLERLRQQEIERNRARFLKKVENQCAKSEQPKVTHIVVEAASLEEAFLMLGTSPSSMLH